MDVTKVKPGQVWADNDWRSEGRTVRVDEIHGDYARCTVLTAAGGGAYGDRWRRTTRIALKRFKPTSTGYRLLEDA